MKLSELVALEVAPEQLEDENAILCGNSVYGISVDKVDGIRFPNWIDEIGLLCEFNERGEISDHINDVAIMRTLKRKSVVIEIPTEIEIPNMSVLVNTAANIKASLSFLPPEDESHFELWCDRIVEAADHILSRPNFESSAYPISSFMQYLFIEIISDTSNFAPSEHYINNRFVNAIPVEKSDEMKVRLRQKIYDMFDGKDKFESIAIALMNKAKLEVEKTAQEIVDQRIGHQGLNVDLSE